MRKFFGAGKFSGGNIISFLSGAVLALSGIYFFSNLPEVKRSYGLGSSSQAQEFPQKYQIISPVLPEKMDFCGEAVPLNNVFVRERFERELIVNTYYHSATLLGIKRANRWFPVIEPILKKNGIPEDFKYIVVIESNFEHLISPAGAVGFWQFTQSSAERYGLQVDSEVDERYNVEKSTQAACDYIKYAYNQFKSWTLTAASYNMGLTGISKQQERQKVKNYYNLLLGEETSRYVARILAVKAIFTHPQDYGYLIKKEDLYSTLEYDEVKVTSDISNLADFSVQHGINYKLLKIFNPWLRENNLTVKNGKEYTIKIPKKGSIQEISEG
ncbi:MAG: transglycosylase SLT domain-containing protein [Ignavibacteria bacterium]|nr:transglycosylase SLT domain-containing protein [Ignavibacteria bacterium]MCU7503171.1 transglycosylase SLT domain-containing protein [Ignavibacteria bacterium]MCU7518049.1 transglycosylase SLT domain-containing protein [Ignavibacteria bacterium]